MDFSKALEAVKSGKKVSRAGWNGKGLWVEIQRPDQHSKMTRPYLYLVSPRGSTNQFGSEVKDFERVPWLASQTDLLANDWNLIDDSPVETSSGKQKLFAYRHNRKGHLTYLDHEFGANAFIRREPSSDKVVQ